MRFYAGKFAIAALVTSVSVVASARTAWGSIEFLLGSYSIDSNVGSGLIIETYKVAPEPTSFTLDYVGDMEYFDLFKIWTPEEDVGGDDLIPKPISVNFSFTAPAPLFGGTQTGSTVGVSGWVWLVNYQYGQVTWDEPYVFNFGPNSTGQLQVQLSNEEFNFGLYGLHEGKKHSAKVKAKFTLLREPIATPEPLSIATWGGLGLATVGFAGLRRIRRAA
jgi:hypothetical protein